MINQSVEILKMQKKKPKKTLFKNFPLTSVRFNTTSIQKQASAMICIVYESNIPIILVEINQCLTVMVLNRFN